ncbi:SIR2 family protein [Citrobacter freundii]|uniref:SIR2 family protein n=1 Tax=Citrobacter freundii TaxID=546 RepID=UPI001C7DA82D|nr:SIR2 family protein [Citrobacter freundii]
MIDNYVADEKLLIKKRTVKDLADYINIRSGQTPNYSLFLGAGASVTSGIRTGFELVQEWRKEIFTKFSKEDYTTSDNAIEWLSKKHPDWYDKNNEYSSLFERKFDLPSQRRRFVELQVDKKLPSIGYAYLVELFESGFFDTVFTTNFDDLINEAFYQFSSSRPLLCAHDSSIKGISITSARPKIIKLHGDYLFDSIKSSLRETESLENNTREKLIEFSKEYGLIFIGYAGNDTSIMDVLKHLLKQSDYLRNGIYWCTRKGDQITPELFKLLNHEKVYWVEIDGFDQLMAELVHELGGELSFGGNQKSTKREKMIHNFIIDEFELHNHNLIYKDIQKLKKQSYTQDISALINELSEGDNDEQRIPEEAFKNLLSIDNLIRSKNYNTAEDKLKKLIIETEDDNLKSKYLRRLIDIKEDQEDTKSALEYSDKLIELDEFNIGYSLTRTNIFPKLEDKITYLKSLLEKFKYNIDLKNYLCSISLKHLETNDDKVIEFPEIYKLLEESLKQDNSLTNDAWKIKYNAIKCEHLTNHDKTDRNKLSREVLDIIKATNPIHDTYLQLYSDHICSSQKRKKIFECIDDLNEAYKISSKSKRKNILKYLTQLHLSLFEIGVTEDEDDKIDVKFDLSLYMKNFITQYEDEYDVSSIAPFIIFKARYEIGCNKNIQAGINYAIEAMESPWYNDYIQLIVDILLIDRTNIPMVEEFLDTLPRDTSESLILKIKSDIAYLKHDYSTSLALLDEALDKKLNFGSYILAKTFINLLARNYHETIELVNKNIDKVKDVNEKDILIVNRELAKKKLNMEIKKHETLSILSHHSSKGIISMSAFFILDKEFEGTRLLEALLEQDFINYFRFIEWPVLPENIMSPYAPNIIKAA